MVGLLSAESETAVLQTTVWADGVACPDSLASAFAGNNVVIGLGGDPNLVDATCTILAIGEPDGGPVFEYLNGEMSADEILSNLALSAESRAFVVTALSEVDSGVYAYVAESLGTLQDGGYEQFETVFNVAPVDQLMTAAQALADAGFVITASTWQADSYYALVGTRAVGARRVYTAITVETGLVRAADDMTGLVAAGFAPVSTNIRFLSDGGIDFIVIGEKPVGE